MLNMKKFEWKFKITFFSFYFSSDIVDERRKNNIQVNEQQDG